MKDAEELRPDVTPLEPLVRLIRKPLLLIAAPIQFAVLLRVNFLVLFVIMCCHTSATPNMMLDSLVP